MNDDVVGFNRLEPKRLLGTVRTSDQGGNIRRDVAICGNLVTSYVWVDSDYSYPLSASEIDAQDYERARAAIYERAMRRLRDEYKRLWFNHCRDCYYSDRWGKYCGLGRDMVEGCSHKLPMGEV